MSKWNQQENLNSKKLLQVKGLQNAGPKIKAALSLFKWFGIIVFLYK